MSISSSGNTWFRFDKSLAPLNLPISPHLKTLPVLPFRVSDIASISPALRTSADKGNPKALLVSHVAVFPVHHIDRDAPGGMLLSLGTSMLLQYCRGSADVASHFDLCRPRRQSPVMTGTYVKSSSYLQLGPKPLNLKP